MDSSDLGFIVLGTGINQETNEIEQVAVGDVERRGGIYVLGQPRTGKSTLLINMMSQDIRHGHGLCFIDPHGDAIDEVIKLVPNDRLDDVILLDPLDEDYAVGLHLFACKNPRSRTQISRTINYVLQVFGKLFTESGNLQDAVTMYDTLLNTIILLVYNQEYTLAEVPLILVNRDAAAKLIESIGDAHDDEKEWWKEYNGAKFPDKEKISGSTRRRLRTFLTDENVRHIVGQNRSTLDFRAIMDTGKILLVKLPREFPELTKLIGSLIIGQLLTAAYSRDDIPEDDRKQFCLYCDEFQNFATPDFAQLFTQTGKYHIAPTVAHQERVGQFAEEKQILGATSAAAIKVLFQTTVNDAEEFAPEFAREPEPQRTEEIEKQEIDGEEEIKAIAQKPIDYLVRETHASARVREVTASLLVPLIYALDHVIAVPDWELWVDPNKTLGESKIYRQTYAGKEYIATYQQLSKGKMLLNALLVDVMEERAMFSSTGLAKRFASLANELRGFLGIQSALQYNKNTVINNSWHAVELDGYCITTFFPQMASLVFQDGQSSTSIQRMTKHYVQAYLTHLKAERWEYLQREYHYLSDPSDFFTKMLHEYMAEMPEQVNNYVNHLVPFYRHLTTLCRELREQPIRIGTGQHRQRIRTVTHYITYPRRTVADMVNEMAQEFSNLPRFTAYCKIVRTVAGQQKVVKYKLSPDKSESLADEENTLIRKKAYIIDRMHDESLGYYKKRELVEQEIAARRAVLKAKEPKRKGQTTSDEDEG